MLLQHHNLSRSWDLHYFTLDHPAHFAISRRLILSQTLCHIMLPFFGIFTSTREAIRRVNTPRTPAQDTFIDLSRLAWVIIGCHAGLRTCIWGIWEDLSPIKCKVKPEQVTYPGQIYGIFYECCRLCLGDGFLKPFLGGGANCVISWWKCN